MHLTARYIPAKKKFGGVTFFLWTWIDIEFLYSILNSLFPEHGCRLGCFHVLTTIKALLVAVDEPKEINSRNLNFYPTTLVSPLCTV